MLNNIPQRLARIVHRAYRQAKPVKHTLLAMLVTIGIFMSSVSVSPPSQAALVVGQGFTVTPADLAFILQQIKIAEAHALAPNADPTGDPANCQALLGNGPNQIQSPLLSFGLRTVDGSCNNLLPGQGSFGAADLAFPRLTTPVFNTAENASAFGGPNSSSYAQTSGSVADSQPRLISNLIVDQTSANLAAVAAAGFPVRSQGAAGVVPCETVPGSDPPVDLVPATPVGCVPAFQTLFIENVTTDVGLSPPFNSLFTIFGQFFDHGLDKITNGGNGTVFVPLKADDPLVAGPDHIFGNADDLPAGNRFMVLTRGTIKTGPDGFRSAPNTDTPFVDQSQTYTSHSSHQVFTREYVNNTDGKPVSTGKFLSSSDGGLPTWAMTKAQAADLLGLELTDANVGNIPMIAADQYGNFIPGTARGLPQYVTTGGLVEGCRVTDASCVGPVPVPVPANAIFIDTAFLNDIAHSAGPKFTTPTSGVLFPDADFTAGGSLNTPAPAGSYDDELLDIHAICGDGRCNENIALQAIHQVFHSEHDRLIDYIKNVLTTDASATGVAALPEWRLATGAANWNGKRLFQAARFVTEMEYQHLVFEEFARKIQPAINVFEPFAFNQTNVNPAITAEFAHAVYRFGHSMLTDTIPRKNEAGSVPSCTPTDSPACLNNDISLFDGFLNPAAYYDGGPAGSLTSQAAAGSIIMGLSDEAGNEIDEFVSETLRNRLLGLPLDLPSLNMARARSEGIPSLNNVRRQIFAATNDGQMTPYINWVDFAQSLKHPESLVNFVAAYGKHPTITAQTTLAGKRRAADQLVNGTTLPGPDGILFDNPLTVCSTPNNPVGCDESADNIFAPADLGDFMFSTAAWANVGNVSVTGLDDIDLWVGGLAERTNLFGGLLGTTFNYVFENQLTNLQNGDRFYYLARTPGMNLRAQLEGNSFAEMVMRNTNVHTLKADPFATADCKFELGRLTFPASPGSFITGAGSVNDDPFSECDENRLLLRQPNGQFRYREINSVDPVGINGQSVYNGAAGDVTDRIYGGNDSDTFWGGAGDDFIEGGDGADVALGGFGDDVLTDTAGDDILKGGPGDDAIDGGPGLDIIEGGDGNDFTNGGANANETFGGPGNDFAIAGQSTDAVFGDSGDDWIEGGDQPDLLIGDSSTLFFDDHNLPGHDILIGQGGDDDYDGEGGDDIFVAGPGVEKNAGSAGYDWSIGLGDPQPQDADLSLVIVNAPQANETRDRFNEVEGLSGWKFNDALRGDDVIPSQLGGGGFVGCDALDQAGLDRIAGLDALVPSLVSPLPTAASIALASVTNHCLLGDGNPLTDDFVWGEGNILLGGAGSDQLEGRGADDILDGDRYLNVRISVRSSTTGLEIGSTDLMENAAVTGNFGPNTTGMTLQQAVFAGLVDPGNLVAVREILLPIPAVPAADCTSAAPVNCDTALYSGPQAEYTFDPNPDGSYTIVHNPPAGGGGGGGGIGDGTDTLWNMERLSFCEVPGAVLGTCTTRSIVALVPGGGPDATVSPAVFNFGSVNTNTPTPPTRDFTITRTVPLSVTGVTTTDPAFSITNNTCGITVASGPCTVTVSFKPTTIGETLATLVITHTNTRVPAEPPAKTNVALSGTGIAPVAVLESPLGPLDFGSEPVGVASPPQFITIRNDGNADLVVSSVAVSGVGAASFTATSCGTVVPGNACTITVKFTASSIAAKSGTVRIFHNSNNVAASSSIVPVRGIGTVSLATVSGPLAFGPVNTGATSATQAITVRNTGNANLDVSGVTLTGTNPLDFAIINNGCTAVAPDDTCTINVAFKPITFGAKTAMVSIAHNAGSPSTVALSGTGLAPVAAVAPASLTFNAVNIGTTSAPQNITVSNTGNAPLTVSSFTIIGGTSQFVANGCSALVSVAANSSCIISVVFTPTASAPQPATLTIAHNSNNVAGSSNTVALTGNGIIATAPVATVTPGPLNFGTVITGTTSLAQTITVSNTGTANLSVSGVTLTGANPTQFAIVTNGCAAAVLVPTTGTCTINVAFAPTTTGVLQTAAVSIAHNAAGSPSSVPVSGTGGSIIVTAPVASVSGPLAFGSVNTGAVSATQNVTVSNTGTANLSVSGVTLTGANPTQFAIVTNGCAAAVLVPTTGTCTINVAFAPTTTGVLQTAAVSIAHNAAGSPSAVALSGTGAAAGGPVTASFTNAANIPINAVGPAATYPANLTVSGFPVGATISKVKVTVTGLSHTFTKDIDMLLVGPGGQKATLMSDAGGTGSGTTAVATSVTLTFDATAAAALSATSKVATGTYRPMNLSPSGATADSFPAPGPAAPYTATDLAVFNGGSPNGIWKLFVVDDTAGDSGSIAGGYTVTITTQ